MTKEYDDGRNVPNETPDALAHAVNVRSEGKFGQRMSGLKSEQTRRYATPEGRKEIEQEYADFVAANRSKPPGSHER